MTLRGLFFSSLLIAAGPILATAPSPLSREQVKKQSQSFEQWISQQEKVSLEKMFENISPLGAARGSVIASPSLYDPPYVYHWIRDAALVMSTVETLFENSSGGQRSQLKNRMLEYLRFSRQNQLTKTLTGLGEPKFHPDGASFELEWCRPQNDGPALRAMVLTRFAHQLLQEGETNLVTGELYDSRWPTQSVIKTDLEYVANHWRDTNCDIWEESIGDHLYNRLVQWRALTDGAALARHLNDAGAAAWYDEQANELRQEFVKYWDAGKQAFVATLHMTGGVNYKKSNLDSQVILGFLHSQALPLRDDRIQATLTTLTETFRGLYPINNSGFPGVGIGRYPEDLYDGGKNTGGNPWFLITAAFAHTHYQIASELLEQGKLASARDHAKAGDAFLKRIQTHAWVDGSLSEQFDRSSGHMKSARDLTWSYSEFIQAAWARKNLKQRLKF